MNPKAQLGYPWISIAAKPQAPDATCFMEIHLPTYYWPLLKMAPIVVTLRDIKCNDQLHFGKYDNFFAPSWPKHFPF